MSVQQNDQAERLQVLEEQCRRDLDQTREQLNEIQLLLQQSNSEAEKLGQREGAITTRVRDMEINLENYTRNDIKTLYTSAHEVGLRLFMMRSQVEQLQMRQQHIKERQDLLNTIVRLLASGLGAQEAAEVATSRAPTVDLGAVVGLARIIEAQEGERQRVSRYLHDGPAQTLANLVLKAEICEHLIDRDSNEARAEMHSLRGNLTTTLQEMRRLIFDLRPMLLDDLGIVPTMRRYLAEIGRSNGFTPTVRGPEVNDHFSPHVRALVFRLVQDVVGGLSGQGQLEQVIIDLGIEDDTLQLCFDIRMVNDSQPPALEPILTEAQVAQRLVMLSATTEVMPVGERGAQLVVTALPPAA